MMMDLQYIIVGLVIAVALAYAAVTFARKTKSFTPNSGCEDDCGCGGKSKTTAR
jgi:hypothetical protein